MPLRRCPDCGRDISASAAACPHCGAARKAQVVEQTSKSWKALQVLGIVLTLLGALTLGAGVFLFVLSGGIAAGNGVPVLSRPWLWNGVPLLVAGFLVFAFARIGSWWHHG